MTLSACPKPRLSVALSACTSDPFDAVIRLLGDAQRYGFDLKKLEISTPGTSSALVSLELEVPSDSDIDNIRDRFSRHDMLSAVVLQAS